MSRMSTIAIIGGGNGAFASAVHLTLEGFKISLCDPYKEGESLSQVISDGTINYTGIFGEGSVVLHQITTDVAEAVEGAELILVCVPATAHTAVAKWLAPVLQAGDVVLLNPGHTGGALNFLKTLRQHGFSESFLLGETSTLTYITRKKDPQTIWIEHVGKFVSVSSLPARKLPQLMERVQQCYPDLNRTKTILGTSLRNLNAIMHPPGMVLGAAWIEHTKGDFYFYQDAATPGVGRLLDKIDQERLVIGKAWDEPLETFAELMYKTGITTEAAKDSGSLRKAFLECEPNSKIKAPPSLDHRYMHEDIMHGLVPMIALGQAADVNAPVMRSLVRIASVVNGIDYWEEGLNRKRLGLEGKSVSEIKKMLM